MVDGVEELLQVEALVATAGDQHGRLEASQGRDGGVGGGRLRVVVVGHPVDGGHPLDAVGSGFERAEGVAQSLRGGTHRGGGGCGREGVGDVVRHRPAQLADRDDRSEGTGQHIAVAAPIGSALISEGPGGTVSPNVAHHGPIPTVGDGGRSQWQAVPQSSLGRLVGSQVAVHVEMVGSEVEPAGRIGREAVAVAEAER